VAGPAGNVVHAASCEQGDVQAAVDAAGDGDVVLVPPGECTWTTPQDEFGNYSHDPSVVIQEKAITLQGAGIDRTVIVDGTLGCDSDCWGQYPLRIVGAEGKPFRLTGISFRGAQGGPPDAFGVVNISGTCKDFRVDHCKFENNHTRGLIVSGHTYGVIDQCVFLRENEAVQCIYGRGDNHEAWQRPLTLGTAAALYIEDCLFEHQGGYSGGVIDGDSGVRYVIRHNMVINSYVVHHGPEFGGSDPYTSLRGGFSFEVYDNVFSVDSDVWTAISPWSGTGVVFNNVFTGTGYFYHPILLRCRRSCQPYPPFGMCNGQSPFDGNTPGMNGYPCLDQVGYATDAGLGTPQAQEPMYEWDNTAKGADVDIDVRAECVTETWHLQENRDFHNDTARPGYSPYVYPHPLTWELQLGGTPADRAILLQWSAWAYFPPTSTWRIEYYTQTLTPPLSETNIVSPTRSYTLVGLTNYVWYTVTLNAMLNNTPFLTDTVRVMPTDRLVHLPLVMRSH
jgi:hypothetical protein